MPSVNFYIFRKFRNRTADAIKCLRRSAKYKAIPDRLKAESDGAFEGGLSGVHEYHDGKEVVREDEAVVSVPHSLSEIGEMVSSSVSLGDLSGSRWRTPHPKSRKGPKNRWSGSDLESMVREEKRLAAEGCRKLNIELAKLFPERSFKGIKGMRRNAKYKSILTSLSAPVAILPESTPSKVVDHNEESRGLPLPPHRLI